MTKDELITMLEPLPSQGKSDRKWFKCLAVGPSHSNGVKGEPVKASGTKNVISIEFWATPTNFLTVSNALVLST